MEKTFEELAEDKPGTIYEDAYENGVRYLIMRGPSCLCAYVGVPLSHPLAGFDYEDIPLSVHGGLTFADQGKGVFPGGWYWYGWDYGHVGDMSFYYLDTKFKELRELGDKAWTVPDVKQEIWSATLDFSKLVELTERICKPQP